MESLVTAWKVPKKEVKRIAREGITVVIVSHEMNFA
jgi:ABC-type polar amino acid transport system ATPase subunit